jgi:hypothetical protein
LEALLRSKSIQPGQLSWRRYRGRVRPNASVVRHSDMDQSKGHFGIEIDDAIEIAERI